MYKFPCGFKVIYKKIFADLRENKKIEIEQ